VIVVVAEHGLAHEIGDGDLPVVAPKPTRGVPQSVVDADDANHYFFWVFGPAFTE